MKDNPKNTKEYKTQIPTIQKKLIMSEHATNLHASVCSWMGNYVGVSITWISLMKLFLVCLT